MIEKISFLTFLRQRHLKAVLSLGRALELDTVAEWTGLIPVFMARLAPSERRFLAIAALSALDPEDAVKVAEETLYDGAGPPLPPLFGYMDEAAFWVEMADPKEAEAYCWKTFHAMAPDRQAAFLEHVQAKEAA
jgi:hypothetical protein